MRAGGPAKAGGGSPATGSCGPPPALLWTGLQPPGGEIPPEVRCDRSRAPSHRGARTPPLHPPSLSFLPPGSQHSREPTAMPEVEGRKEANPTGLSAPTKCPGPHSTDRASLRRQRAPRLRAATGQARPSRFPLLLLPNVVSLINTFPLLPTFLIWPEAAQSLKKKGKEGKPKGSAADGLCSPETHLVPVLRNGPKAPRGRTSMGGGPPTLH